MLATNNTTQVAIQMRYHSESRESPFFSMSRPYRSLIIIIAAFHIVLAAGLTFLSPVSASLWLFLAFVVNLLLQLFPIVFYKPSYGWFHPLVYGSVMSIIQGLEDYSIFRDGIQSHPVLPGWSPENLTLLGVYASVLGSIGLAAYYFGFFFCSTPGVPRLTFPKPRSLGLKAFLITTFAVVVFLGYMHNQGGLTKMILSMAGRSELTEAGKRVGHWAVFIKFSTFVCLIWLSIDRRATLNPIFWGCTSASLGMNFLSRGSRSSVISPVLMGLIVWMLRERKIPFIILLISIIVGLLLVNALGEFRRSTWSGEIDWAALTTPTLSGALDEIEKRKSGSTLYPILAHVPHNVDFLYGQSYLIVLTIPIPRALWREKPRGIGATASKVFYHGSTAGRSPGVIGGAYWNFHIPGVIIVFFLYGAFHKWLVKAFHRYSNAPTAIFPYVFTLYRLAFSDHPMVLWAQGIASIFLILWIVGAISFRFER